MFRTTRLHSASGGLDTKAVRHDFRGMKRNVTVTLDVATARWARIEAARQDVSVSQFLGDLLRERMQREEGYAAAMARYRAGRPARLKSSDRYPSRQELHERTDVR